MKMMNSVYPLLFVFEEMERHNSYFEFHDIALKN